MDIGETVSGCSAFLSRFADANNPVYGKAGSGWRPRGIQIRETKSQGRRQFHPSGNKRSILHF